MSRKSMWLDSVVIVALAVLLVAPLFRIEYMERWSSIESTFISDARMLGENLPHPGWQPLWYTGTRFDYIYPPALRYGTALIAKAGGISTARAYHIYTGAFYILGILGVYWLMIAGTRSRFAAWVATVLSALISPCFLFMANLRADSGAGAPQRLHVLLTYGEGPHISAMCVLPAALAAFWLAVRSKQPGALALSAVLCALVVSNNFYGATALGLLTPIMIWAAWVGERDWRVCGRAAAIMALAWGLCAFWLTPGYLGITFRNLKLVAEPGNGKSVLLLLAALAVFGALSFRFGNRKPERAWAVFTAGAAGLMAFYVLGNYYFRIQVAGNTQRLATELDLFLIVAFATALGSAWTRPRWRLACGLAVLIAVLPAKKYLQHVWAEMPESKSPQTTYVREITRWVDANLRGARVLPSGEVRFWFNAWGNTAQVDGGSQQGMLNDQLPAGIYQILVGDKAEPSILWLQALGADAVIVPDKTSRDDYRGDFRFPEKFRSLPVLFDDGHGTVVYKVPHAYPGIGRIVDAKVLDATGALDGGLDIPRMQKFIGETEKNGREPVSVTWRGFDTMDVRATNGPGESLLLQETWDPSWKAEENGKPVELRKDPVMGFMLLSLPPGAHQLRLHFDTPGENRVGQILGVLSVLVLAWLMWVSLSGASARGEQLFGQSGERRIDVLE